MEHTYRLVISCPDRVGIVAKVSNFLSTYNGWITEASHHSDTQTGWFFMRHEIKANSIPFGLDQFRTAFEPIAREFNMNWHIADSAQPKKVILMCSKESHCVADLLHRWHSREINADQRLIALLAGNSAQQKLASLLLSISDRLAQQGLSSTRLWLPMSRGEISNYLGLTVETVSRVLGHFQRNKILAVNKKDIDILDMRALRDVMHSTEEVE